MIRLGGDGGNNPWTEIRGAIKQVQLFNCALEPSMLWTPTEEPAIKRAKTDGDGASTLGDHMPGNAC